MTDARQREVLTTTELRSALDALSEIDLIRLRQKATALAPGTGMEPDDLLHEAVARSLEENDGRKCPRGVKVATFLGNAMRSIASHEREKWAREMPAGTKEDDKDDPIVSIPDPAPSPEGIVRGRQDGDKVVARIETMFDKDSQAEAIAIGAMAGWSPEEIREIEPMNDREYTAARKRAYRKIRREFQKGLTHE